ncbi:hypothetical protein BCR32DRAFT_303856 [Anaeromyces robustus]|uniref:FLYWCH-type domain-containing protein n=1 Tax=Anaeromyces robustus TaxID=1754192 RepID=A0A1Y1WSP4_9FUNG|nr:hypothetical protein BCR32DRAFT_303856 [Anaeromyces robustus]|eukprot:ORX76415.1 hypothetical protein BCR32DRAFT_303856 [Anaeromyces robustus]
MENLNIEFSETNKGKEQVVINRKYKFNLRYIKKDNLKVYYFTEYKTVNKCKSFIILNKKNEIIEYENLHNHSEKEFDVSISLVKHNIKDDIRKSSIPFEINPKRIFDEISEEIGFICPEYNTVRSQTTRYINKKLPYNIITNFDEIPDESE